MSGIIGTIDYQINMISIVQPQQVPSNCNAIMFLNLGSSTATINQVIPLPQGSVFEVGGNVGEKDITLYQVQFDQADPNMFLIVIYKQYK